MRERAKRRIPGREESGRGNLSLGRTSGSWQVHGIFCPFSRPLSIYSIPAIYIPLLLKI